MGTLTKTFKAEMIKKPSNLKRIILILKENLLGKI